MSSSRESADRRIFFTETPAFSHRLTAAFSYATSSGLSPIRINASVGTLPSVRRASARAATSSVRALATGAPFKIFAI